MSGADRGNPAFHRDFEFFNLTHVLKHSHVYINKNFLISAWVTQVIEQHSYGNHINKHMVRGPTNGFSAALIGWGLKLQCNWTLSFFFTPCSRLIFHNFHCYYTLCHSGWWLHSLEPVDRMYSDLWRRNTHAHSVLHEPSTSERRKDMSGSGFGTRIRNTSVPCAAMP